MNEAASLASSSDDETKVRVRNLDIYYGETHAIKSADLDIRDREILALIGPSGCGKSTFLRALNRMNDIIPSCRTDGVVELDGRNIYDKDLDPVLLRARVGMVSQSPNPFPKSIYDNLAFGPRVHGLIDNKQELDEVVERSLKRAGLWTEVKEKMKSKGTDLSGGQQQRLCIARAIANDPEVILLDEPCSALDPQSTEIIEDLMKELAERYCIVIVTHNMQQAQRVADRVAFFHLGVIVETHATETMFDNPEDERTREYVRGAFG